MTTPTIEEGGQDGGPAVSVVIPARDAAATLAATLASLAGQTFAAWEAIVVDDGSTDDTAALAQAFARRDPRIRVERRPAEGVSAARNAGIASAAAPWLLFLDADDLLVPDHLERLLAEAGGSLDAVCCGWRFLAPDGELGAARSCPPGADPRALLADHCAFAIHSCLVRRARVVEAGGFDPHLSTCEDWDLWQRVARGGARFAFLPDALAIYRMREGSCSLDPHRLLGDGLAVIARGHGADRGERGRPPDVDWLRAAFLGFAAWCAGLAIGRGEEPRPLLDRLGRAEELRGPGLDPGRVAAALHLAIPLAGSRTEAAWPELWPAVEAAVGSLLVDLEARTAIPSFAARASRALERQIAAGAPAARPLAVGSTRAVRLELTEPLTDVEAPGAERLIVDLALAGEPLGAVELPVAADRVPSAVLADAVTAGHAWPIVRRFLAERGGEIAEEAAWGAFLAALWDRPGWPAERFYDAAAAHEGGRRRAPRAGWLEVEVSEELPSVAVGEGCDLVVCLGGAPLGTIRLPARMRPLDAHALRVAIAEAGGFELCRAAVREAVLGRPLGGGSLRERLAAAAARRGRGRGAAGGLRHGGAGELAPGAAAVASGALGGRPGLVLARHAGAIGTSASRRAELPAAAAADLLSAADAAAEPALRSAGEGARWAPPERAVYAPEVLWRPVDRPAARRAVGRRAPAGARALARLTAPRPAPLYGRGHFEALFAARRDPWRYTTAYEEAKYEQTLALLPPGRIRRALELAAAEGHFTARLLPRVERLVAADISRIALDRVAERCRGLGNLETLRLDAFRDPLPGGFDLVVASEVLYYLADRRALAAMAERLAAALVPGGRLLAAHANLVADDPAAPGFDWDHPFGARVIGEVLAAAGGLRLEAEIATPLYRIQRFRRERAVAALAPRRRKAPPVRREAAEAPPLEPEVAARFLWHGGRPRKSAAPAEIATWRLPILLYHRIAPSSAQRIAPSSARRITPSLARRIVPPSARQIAPAPAAHAAAPLDRYRVSPEAFEEQLAFLKDAGFYTPRLADWRRAAAARRPLPGRAVLLTFDDGDLSFAEHAWPLLERYGFSALVFLVAEEVGGQSRWDAVFGPTFPLLGWEEVRRLARAGVELGSHSARHVPLTALPPAGVVREAARSRAILTRRLGRPGHPVTAFAYPYGDVDPAVAHLVGACGYLSGLTCQPERAGFESPELLLPRLEVRGEDDFAAFVRLVMGGEP